MAEALWARNYLDGMSEAERERLLADAFSWVQGKRLPPAAYWARLLAFPTVFHEYIELAPADDGNGWEILMDLKPSTDPFYANLWGTQGMTVMMRQNLGDLTAQHEREESAIKSNAKFRFCGVVTDPDSPRHHAYVNVFARLLPQKPEKFEGSWLPLNAPDKIHDGRSIIPLCRKYMALVAGVMLEGEPPDFWERFELG